MNTLRQIEQFIGQEGIFGLRFVGSFVPKLSSTERSSMRAMIAALQHLPPLTLDVEMEGDSEQVIPFGLEFQLAPSTCAIFDTVFTLLFSNGLSVPGILPNRLGNSNVSGTVILGRLNSPGEFVVNVTRTGVSSTGAGTLEKSFPVVAQPKAVPPPSPIPPHIAVKTNPDGSFVVSGSGFAHAKPIAIRAQDQINPQNQLNFVATASAAGVLADFQTGVICVVPGGQITFSAQDGTLDPTNNHPVISNFVTVTCPKGK